MMPSPLTWFLLWSCFIGQTVAFQALPIKFIARQESPSVVRSSLSHTAKNVILVYDNVNGAAADEGRKDRTSLSDGYTGLSKLYLISGLFLFLLTGTNRKFSAAAGFVVAAGFSRILSDATDHGRLGSNTYKRLNLGLVAFNLISLLTIPAQLRQLRRLARGAAFVSMATFCQTLGIGISIVGWRRGLGDGADLLKELKEGIQSTLRSVWATQGRGTLYRNALLPVLVGIVVVACKLASSLLDRGVDSDLYACGLARLGLVATAIYNLKDAGERDRLTGTTFIHLNQLFGVWLVLCKLFCLAVMAASDGEWLSMAEFGIDSSNQCRSWI